MAVKVKRRQKLVEEYPFPPEAIQQIAPIITLIEAGQDPPKIRTEIGQLALNLCEGIKAGAISSAIADQVFTLLDLYLDEQYSELELGASVEDLLFEGMLLHDLGQDYGADLDTLENLARQVLKDLEEK